MSEWCSFFIVFSSELSNCFLMFWFWKSFSVFIWWILWMIFLNNWRGSIKVFFVFEIVGELSRLKWLVLKLKFVNGICFSDVFLSVSCWKYCLNVCSGLVWNKNGGSEEYIMVIFILLFFLMCWNIFFNNFRLLFVLELM